MKPPSYEATLDSLHIASIDPNRSEAEGRTRMFSKSRNLSQLGGTTLRQAPTRPTIRLGRKRLAGGAATLLALLVAATPVAAMGTVYQSGAVGPMLQTYSNLQCTNRVLRSTGVDIGRTSTYPSSNQTIQMWSRLERSSNNKDWYVKELRGPFNVLTKPGQKAIFGPQEYGLSKFSYYRITMIFRWYIGSTKVGEVWDRYLDSELSTYFGAYRESVGGWASCYIPY